MTLIADPHEGPPTCALCEHLGRCPTPQACEQAEEERRSRSALRDVFIAAALIAVVLLVLYWRSM